VATAVSVVSVLAGALVSVTGSAEGAGAESEVTSVATGAVSVPASVSAVPRPGRRSVQVTSRSLPDPDISQLPLRRLVPLVPLASSMTTSPLLV
jgi:hypothetical protein